MSFDGYVDKARQRAEDAARLLRAGRLLPAHRRSAAPRPRRRTTTSSTASATPSAGRARTSPPPRSPSCSTARPASARPPSTASACRHRRPRRHGAGRPAPGAAFDPARLLRVRREGRCRRMRARCSSASAPTMDVTGTLKHVKSRLQEEGYDPAIVARSALLPRRRGAHLRAARRRAEAAHRLRRDAALVTVLRGRRLSPQPSMIMPPSTAKHWPVMKCDTSLARNTITGPASASGSPSLPPSGMTCCIAMSWIMRS